MHSLNPSQNTGSESRLTVPAAYRAWAYWCNTQGSGGHQVSGVKKAFEDWGSLAHDELAPVLTALCEVYARSVMEVAIGLHFSRADSCTDCLVLEQITQLFNEALAREVWQMVRAQGSVARDFDTRPNEASEPY